MKPNVSIVIPRYDVLQNPKIVVMVLRLWGLKGVGSRALQSQGVVTKLRMSPLRDVVMG